MSVETWNRRHHPIIFLDQVFDCGSLARWMLECAAVDFWATGYYWEKLAVSETLFLLAQDMKFLQDVNNSFFRDDEKERDAILLDVTRQFNRLQRAVQACGEVFGCKKILGRHSPRPGMSPLHSGTALMLALMKTGDGIQDADPTWSWEEFKNERLSLNAKVHQLWRSRNVSTWDSVAPNLI